MIPKRAAERLDGVAAESRKWAIAYVVALFSVIPGTFALLNHYLLSGML